MAEQVVGIVVCVFVCGFFLGGGGGGGGFLFTLHTFMRNIMHFSLFLANRGNVIYNLSCYPHLGFVNS